MSKLSIKRLQNNSYDIAVGLVGDVGYISVTDNGLYPDGDSRADRRDMGFNNFMVPLMTRDKLKELRNIIKQVLKESK
jgi:hypothetical protein